MSKDLSPILAGWDFDPQEPQVRIIQGEDGRDKLQMRIDLGVLQMELSGRPDGQRPFKFESLLEYHEDLAARSADEEGYSLEAEACAELYREGMQYYHRYLACFHLERYDLVERDTARNLRLFAFVLRHATRDEDRVQFDQFRPYVTMMNTRAGALQALARKDHLAALEQIDAGIDAIRGFLQEYDQAGREADCVELGFLRNWRREVEDNRPIGPLERLEQQLRLAVAREQYEEAARLRDQIKRLQGPAGPARL